MPYIKPEEKPQYEPELSVLCKKLDISKKGHLTYIAFALARARWKRLGGGKPGYTNISESLGALIDAAEQMREEDLSDYERKVKRENGDVLIAEDGSIIYD